MRRELGPMMRLAVPVVLAEIGWMAMGLVDTLIVGPLGPAAIGATGMSSTIFFAFAVFGMGVMLGLDPLVSQAFGAGRLDECERWLQHGVCLALVIAPVLMVIAYAAFATIDSWNFNPQVLALARPYLAVVTLSTPPLLLYATFRRYLQGMHVVRPVTYALVSANIINAVGNWMLVYGKLGMPELGVTGSAWATGAARTYMALFLYVAIVRVHRRRQDRNPHARFKFEGERIRHLLRLGVPAAFQVTLEVGVFAAVSVLAGRLDPVALGSHQIAINIASLAFMVPLGLSSAASVRVGHAIGGREFSRAVQAGWVGFATGLGMMTIIATTFVIFPEALVRVFTTDRAVIELGARLLFIAACFQLFDGTQAVATGVLRGLGDTRTPMITNAIGHWVFGLPIGYALCFGLGWGVSGLWLGLTVGLILVALALVVVWIIKARHLDASSAHVPEMPDLL